MKSLLLLFLSVHFLLCSKDLRAQNDPPEFKIYDVKNEKEINLDDLVQRCKGIDAVFFGELHNDSIAHVIEYDLLQKLFENHDRKIALSLEAISDDYQVILNEYLKGWISLDEYEKLANSWPPFFHNYTKLLNFAKSNEIPVIAANVPNRYVEIVSSRGMESLDSLPAGSKKFLPPLPYYVPKGNYYEKYVKSLKGSVDVNINSYSSFCLYDATMAYNIDKFLRENKNENYTVLHITGKFHIDQELGTIIQLNKLSEVKFLTISCFYDNIKSPNWDEYKNLADIIIITDKNIKKTF